MESENLSLSLSPIVHPIPWAFGNLDDTDYFGLLTLNQFSPTVHSLLLPEKEAIFLFSSAGHL